MNSQSGHLSLHRCRLRRKWEIGNVPQWFVVCVVLCSVLPVSTVYRNCEPSSGVLEACDPAPVPILTTARITVTLDPPNATCGQTAPEDFRRLGDEETVLMCAAADHDKDRIVDENGTSTWWQSTTWKPSDYIGADPLYAINITVSLNKKYRLSNDVIMFWDSGRPQQMVIEKSADYGKTWQPMQYYARSCTSKYPDVPTSFTENATEIVCSTRYSQDSSNTDREAQVILNGTSSRLTFTPILANYFGQLETTGMKDFMTVTDLRFRLLKPATDGQEYTGRTPNAPSTIYAFKEYYYAISDLKLTGSCFCNLHGNACMSEMTTKETVCVCAHNTEGKDCERCKPLYNNKPWQAGTFTPYPTGKANACEACECNGHSDSCTYNATLGFGKCENCKNNTTGPMCSECLDTFYQNPNASVPLSSNEICLPCDCLALGLEDPTNLACVKNRSQENIGQCSCKPQVTGRKCDQCEDEFYGFLIPESIGTCKPCDCDQYGTVEQQKICDQVDGQCPCKASTAGRQCERCKDGYYRFPETASEGCETCGCDPGGSALPTCTDVGICSCKKNITGTKCKSVAPNFYIPALDEYILQPESGECTIQSDLWTVEKPFDGRKFATCRRQQSVVFETSTGSNNQLELIWPYHIFIRYTLEDTQAWEGAMLDISIEGNTNIDVSRYAKEGDTPPSPVCPLTTGDQKRFNITFSPGVSTAWMSQEIHSMDVRCSYKLTLTLPNENGSTTNILIDSVVFLPSLNHSDMGTAFRTLTENGPQAEGYVDCYKELASLSTRAEALTTSSCSGLLWSVAAEVVDEAKPCECNINGSVCPDNICRCDSHGGQCVCKHGVGGRSCDQCLPGYYNMTAAGCTLCDCQKNGSQNGACAVDTGQCPCRPNVAMLDQITTMGVKAGRYCGACLENHYGYGDVGGCTSCNCDEGGSNGTQCSATGQCPCQETIGGLQCDRCADGYHSLLMGRCQSCDCNLGGSVASVCDVGNGSCTCKTNVQGDKCDTCKESFFNLAEQNPSGCQPCFCFNKGSNCSSADGFQKKLISSPTVDTWEDEPRHIAAPAEYLGDKKSSYGQLFSLKLGLTGDEGDLSDIQLVTINGENRNLTYTHTSPVMAGQNEIKIWLYPENLKLDNGSSPTAAQLYEVLSQITRISIRTVINGVQIDVSSVTMVTAEEAEGVTVADGAGYVEKCSCDPKHNVSGLSCEKCATGFKLNNATAADIRFETCTACFCTSREYDPLECDQMTGVCLNCRNGTTGDFCENCSANVVGPECSTCAENYWGLSPKGCQECNCSSPGTNVSTSCNNETGQCVCKAHVTGRQCDVCEDNYHSLTEMGCSECDDCYRLVLDEADKLRAMIANLSEVLNTIKAGDDTVNVGPWVDRVDNANTALNTLLQYLETVTTEENSINSAIGQLNASIASLTARLDTANNTDTTMIKQQLTDTQTSLTAASQYRNQTIDNMKTINTDIGPLNQLGSSLTDLVASLSSVETFLNSLSSDGQAAVDGIKATVTSIEDLSRRAAELSQADLQQLETLISVHQETSLNISTLNNVDLVMETLSSSAISEADRIQEKGSLTLTTANTLTEEQLQIDSVTVDFAAKNASLQDHRTNILSISGTTRAKQPTLDAKKQTVEEAASNAIQQQLNTNNVIMQYDVLNARVTAAEDLSENAQIRSTQVFADAQNMVDVMINFASKRQDAEARLSTEEAKANDLITRSSVVSQQATNLATLIDVSQQRSSEARDKARQAKTVAQTHEQDISPVQTQANELSGEIVTDLSSFVAAIQEPLSIKANSINAAESRCETLQSDIQTANANIQNAMTQAGSNKDEVQLKQAEASQLLNTISTLPAIDNQRIQTLLTEVAQLQNNFNETELEATVAQIKANYDIQTAWYNQLKAKKASLERQIEAIKTSSQLIVTV